VDYACNPRILDAELGGLQIQDKLELHSETLPEKTKG
jgi:hypothetical protein